MKARKNKSGYVIFGWLLPFCFLAPELINIGFMFVRWDYLLIAIYTAAILTSTSNNRTSSNWTKRTFAIVLLYILFAIYQASALRDQSGLLEGIKYASWPIKVLIWGIGVHFIYKNLNCSVGHVYLFIKSTTILVFSIQIMELTLPGFRNVLFDLYPVAAQERLAELSFRARGPFNGYDLASIYFVVAGVFLHQYHQHYTKSGGKRFVVYAVCLCGAFISARTGFLLLLAYFTLYAYTNYKPIIKLQAVSLLAAIISVIYLTPVNDLSGVDDSILGRYYELLSGLLSGDLTQISSVAGTFYMNEVLMETEDISTFGQGLTADTTADQLYFKYLFMFGITGLLLWIFIHFYITIQANHKSNSNEAATVYRRTIVIVSIILALAHIKGGNYFFSSRLGDIIALLLILGTTTPSLSSKRPSNNREKSSHQPL